MFRGVNLLLGWHIQGLTRRMMFYVFMRYAAVVFLRVLYCMRSQEQLCRLRPPRMCNGSPSSASEWREEVVDLTPVAGHDDIFILIVGIKGSDEGRTIHIDDLSFDGSASGPGPGGSVVGVPLASSQDVILYPNPVEDGVVSLDVSSVVVFLCTRSDY